MADDKFVRIVLQAVDNFTTPLKDAQTEVDKLTKSVFASAEANKVFSEASTLAKDFSSVMASVARATMPTAAAILDLGKTIASVSWDDIKNGFNSMSSSVMSGIDQFATYVGSGLRAAFTADMLPILSSAAMSTFSVIGTAATAAWDILKTGAGLAWDGIQAAFKYGSAAVKEAISILTEGGEYNEMREQFNSLAASMGVSGEKIINNIHRISEGTISLSKATAIAAKAAMAGLSEKEIETIATAIKRSTEALGTDYEQAMERAFGAISKGKVKGLAAEMGVAGDKFTSVTDLVKKADEGLQKYGDTSVNVGDTFKSIAVDIDDFKLKLFSIAESSPVLEDMFSYLAKTVDEFLRSFDYQSAQQFFDSIINGALVVWKAIQKTFGGVYNDIYETFAALGTEQGIRGFFKSLGEWALWAGKGFLSISDQAIDAFTLILAAGGSLISDFGVFWKSISFGAFSATRTIVGLFEDAWASIAQMGLQFIANNPFIANAMGMDTVGDSLLSSIRAIRQAKQEWESTANSMLTEKTFGNQVEGIGDGLQKLALKLNASKATAKTYADEFAKNIEEGFKAFEIAPKRALVFGDVMKAQTEEQARLAAERRKALDKADEDEEKARLKAEKAANDSKARLLKAQEAADKKEYEQYKKALEDKEKLLRDSLKQIEALEKKVSDTTKAGGGFITFNADETKLLQQKDSIVKAIKEIDDAKRNLETSKTADLLKSFGDPQKLKDLAKELSDIKLNNGATVKAKLDTTEFDKTVAEFNKGTLGKMKVGVDGKLTLDDKGKKSNTINVNIQGANGQSAIIELVKEVIRQIVTQLKSETLPLVVSASPI